MVSCGGWMILATNILFCSHFGIFHLCTSSSRLYIVIYKFLIQSFYWWESGYSTIPDKVPLLWQVTKMVKTCFLNRLKWDWYWSESAPHLEQTNHSLEVNESMERFVGMLPLTTHMQWKHGIALTNWTNQFYPFEKCTTNALCTWICLKWEIAKRFTQ